jgi:translation initiation factor 2 subunit 3
MNEQPTLNIGLIGHVSHGKTTIINALTGIKTQRFKSELEKNITIKLGYANCKIFKCNDKNCPSPSNYKSTNGDFSDNILCHCGSKMDLVRKVSFVDCPGHGVLMSTMLNGASIMDAVIIVIAANESFPQKQTIEHYNAIKLLNLKNTIIVQNKVDLVKEEEAYIQYEEIRDYFDNDRIIPICARLKYNIDVLCEYIAKISEPLRVLSSKPKLTIVRSFDVNKPGEKIESLKGGVCGGTLSRGILRVGDDIEIKPGIVTQHGYIPIFNKIISIYSENNILEYAIPGGLIGIGTNIDPFLTKGDKLVGHIIGHKGTLPDVYNKIIVKYEASINMIKGECLIINVGSTTTCGKIEKIKNKLCKLCLTIPICVDIGENILISKIINKKPTLIGKGEIMGGCIMNSLH